MFNRRGQRTRYRYLASRILTSALLLRRRVMDNGHSKSPPWICGDNLTATQEPDVRLARALNLRIDEIDGELLECDAAIEACQEYGIWLGEQRSWLARSLWEVEKRLAQAAFRQCQEVAA